MFTVNHHTYLKKSIEEWCGFHLLWFSPFLCSSFTPMLCPVGAAPFGEGCFSAVLQISSPSPSWKCPSYQPQESLFLFTPAGSFFTGYRIWSWQSCYLEYSSFYSFDSVVHVPNVLWSCSPHFPFSSSFHSHWPVSSQQFPFLFLHLPCLPCSPWV